MADIEENARRRAAGNKEIPLSPIAIEVVRRIDALFGIERSINGKSPQERMAIRQTLSCPLVDDLRAYMREQAPKLSRGHDLAKAIQYSLNLLDRAHALPRRRPPVRVQQRRRARGASRRGGAPQLDLRRIRRRRSPRRQRINAEIAA